MLECYWLVAISWEQWTAVNSDSTIKAYGHKTKYKDLAERA